MKWEKDFTGSEFLNWKVTGKAYEIKGQPYFICECTDCGEEKREVGFDVMHRYLSLKYYLTCATCKKRRTKKFPWFPGSWKT